MGKQYQTTDVQASMPGLTMPEQVSVALAEIAESATEGLLALAVGAGLQVLGTLMEESVTALAGPKGNQDPDRTAVRHGHERGSVTLGGRRVASSGRGSAPPMARVSCRWRPRSCSRAPRSWAASPWSGCLAGCLPAATRLGWSRWAPRSNRPPPGPASRPCRAGLSP
jgi:hypothetical protein